MMKKRLLTYLPELILAVLILGAASYIAFITPTSLVNWYNNDDGFFYFKVAQNITSGLGVTFDGINPTNGFHPLWMLICLPVFALRGDLLVPLRIIVLIFGTFQLVTAILLYRMIAARVNRWLAVLLVISFIFSWTVFNNTFTGGLESALSMMMTVITWRMAVRYHSGEMKSYRYLGLIGLAAGLTILARLDNFILVGFLGIWLVLDRKSDSSLLLLDILVPILLVMAATIQRIGYNVPLVGLLVYLLTAAYILFGCALFFLVGFYGQSPIHIPIRNWFLRGLLAGMISAGLAGGIIYALGSRGMFNLFPRSVLVITVVAWILYSTIIRAWLARRVYAKDERTVLTLQASIRKIGVWLKKPAVFLGPVFGLVGAYMVWSQVNFNTVMPVSGQIKQWWGTLEVTTYGSPIHSLAGLQHYLYSHESPFSMLYEIVYAVTSTLRIPNFPDSTAAWLILAGAYLILLVYEQKKTTRVLVGPTGDSSAYLSDSLSCALFLHLWVRAHAVMVLDCGDFPPLPTHPDHFP